MIYLCIISIVGLSLSFSRYTSGDTKTEDARAAAYDVEIHSGDLQSVEQNMTMTVYETKCGSIPLMVLDYLGKTEAELADYTDVRNIINEKNKKSFKEIENSGTIDTGESRTFFIISWVEHDNIYKADADLNEDKISHKTLKELNAESESFTIKLTSAQVD